MLGKDLICSQEGPWLIGDVLQPCPMWPNLMGHLGGGGSLLGDTCSTSRTALSPFLVQSSHVLYSHAKDEQVLFPGFLGHLHVGPIHGPDGQGPIQHELHIACPWGFGACGGDLLRQICGWNDCKQGVSSRMRGSVSLDLLIQYLSIHLAGLFWSLK